MVSYRKPIIQDIQMYETQKVCVAKACDVKILKCDEKVQAEHVERKFNSYLCSVKDVRKWRKEKKIFGWFNEILGNFCFLTKKRISL
uniref:Uncharacterized protein n=1 Tax=Lactuca sativa TaxID=4236 RepID=A0A9R1VUI1_LACSA|nr:hypothetical protein LSAT_V11C400193120 [Lactuca sativa]